MGNFQRIKTNSKLKNIAVEIKNSTCGLNIRINTDEERISELEDRSSKKKKKSRQKLEEKVQKTEEPKRHMGHGKNVQWGLSK